MTLNQKIKVCIDFNKRKPLSRWHNDNITTNNFFDNKYFDLVKWHDFKLGENNFLFLYCVPDETVMFLETVESNFYKIIKQKNIKILFWNEQFNLFMFDGNIFKFVPHIKHNCYDINEMLYWKITNILKKHNIREENLFFIHSAKGFLEETEQMRQKKILWIKTTLDLKSKHIQFNNWLPWGSNQKVNIAKNLRYHYACLFAGRPAKHRYNLIKNLWEKELLNFGKCSLSRHSNDSSEFDKINLLPIGQVNTHLVNDMPQETSLFQDIFLWVAGETYCPNGYPYFTEKTIKAILYERPFISYGNPGTLAYLRDHGFKTFDAYWDESYDNEKDDDKKIEMIAQIIKNICKKNIVDINRMHDDMKPILEHNKNLLVNTDWREDLIKFLS
jgi:hypothetical protein